MEIVQFTENSQFVEESVQFICASIEEAIALRGHALIGLSGGRTPRPVYEALAMRDLDWAKIEFFIVDERYVPTDHPDSNYKMIREIFGARAIVHFFDTRLVMEECLQKYAEEFKGKLDLAILGIGVDGHFGSVFPESVALESSKVVEHTVTEQFAVRERMTLTSSTILESEKILVLLSGTDKKFILEEIQSSVKKPQEFPAVLLKYHPQISFYYLSI